MVCPLSNKFWLLEVNFRRKNILKIFEELKQAFKDCQTIAEFVQEDNELMVMCFQTIFNADYFWDWNKVINKTFIGVFGQFLKIGDFSKKDDFPKKGDFPKYAWSSKKCFPFLGKTLRQLESFLFDKNDPWQNSRRETLEYSIV